MLNISMNSDEIDVNIEEASVLMLQPLQSVDLGGCRKLAPHQSNLAYPEGFIRLDNPFNPFFLLFLLYPILCSPIVGASSSALDHDCPFQEMTY